MGRGSARIFVLNSEIRLKSRTRCNPSEIGAKSFLKRMDQFAEEDKLFHKVPQKDHKVTQRFCGFILLKSAQFAKSAGIG